MAVIWIPVLAIHILMSVVTLVAYGLDKRAAERSRPRVRERTLHAMELLGGWPGGLAGRRVFRHKTRDWGFLAVSWLILVVHAVGWAGAGWVLR